MIGQESIERYAHAVGVSCGVAPVDVPGARPRLTMKRVCVAALRHLHFGAASTHASRNATLARHSPESCASFLDLSALDLRIDAPALRCSRRLCRSALGRRRCSVVDQRLQPCEGVLAIAVLASIALRLDHQNACARDALVAGLQQPSLHGLRQRRSSDVIAQMQRRRHLVDVLAARSLRADRGPFGPRRGRCESCRRAHNTSSRQCRTDQDAEDRSLHIREHDNGQILHSRIRRGRVGGRALEDKPVWLTCGRHSQRGRLPESAVVWRSRKPAPDSTNRPPKAGLVGDAGWLPIHLVVGKEISGISPRPTCPTSVGGSVDNGQVLEVTIFMLPKVWFETKSVPPDEADRFGYGLLGAGIGGVAGIAGAVAGALLGVFGRRIRRDGALSNTVISAPMFFTPVT